MAGLRTFKAFFICISLILISSFAHGESEILIQNKKAPVLRADKKLTYEIKYSNSLSQLFAFELANRMLLNGLRSKIESSYLENLNSAYKEKSGGVRSDYLIDIKFIEHIVFSTNPLSKGMRFFIKVLDNKTGEIIKEFYEDNGYVTQVQMNNGTGLQLMMETKGISTFRNIFEGYEAAMDYIKIKLPVEKSNCEGVKRSILALNADLNLAAEEISNRSLLECKAEHDQEILNGLSSIAELKLGNKDRSIKILEQFLKNNKSELLTTQLSQIKKFGIAEWR